MPDTKQPTEKRPVGRPADVGGKRVQVYLDAESLSIASELGNGNVSHGIRRALRQALLTPNVMWLCHVCHKKRHKEINTP